jgi:DNA primase
MSTVDEVKSRLDIVDLVSESVKLRRAGKNYSGFCPFHSNTRTPAFVVFPETGTWRCFGECNEGGDIFKYVMKKEGWDFKEALQHLAERAGVQLEAYTPAQEAAREEYDRLRALLEDAVTFYRNQLLTTAAGKVALDYLRDKRQLSEVTIETFGLGYAPQGWDNALKHFSGRGYTEAELFESGLLSERESGGYYDRFRQRIMFPIRDERGRMAGFGARILDPDDVPKFLNSPETPVFSKGRLLYGLDRARKPIRAADQVVIVEGYLDVIAVHQAGFENVVSPMGTALTEDQLRLLKRFTRKIVLALDPDAAGQKAVLRGLEAVRQAMDREGELRFDARGLLRNEARLQADLRVASMPDELDPDEIVQRDPEEWPRLIAAAKPIVTHVMDTLVADQDVNDPKVKSSIAAQVLPLIEDLPDPVERDTYRQQLSRLLRVDERSLISRPVRTSRSRRGTRQQLLEKPIVSSNPSQRIEAHCLNILLRRPELLYRLDRQLQESSLGALNPEDFGYTDHQILLRLIQQAVQQDAEDAPRYVSGHMPEALQDLSQELLAQAEKLDPVDERNLEELVRNVIQLRRLALGENLNQLRFLQEEAQQQGDLRATSYQELVLQHTRLLRDLDQAGRKLSLRRVE